MAKKQYKNVYTILEKAKKGELDFTESSPRLYSNIRYNVKDEIIKPYLHYLDKTALENSVDNFIASPNSHSKIIALASSQNKGLFSPETLYGEMQSIYSKFPKSVINDIYNINYEDIQNLKFEDRTEKNKFRFQLIEQANNSVAKVVTRQHNINSMVYTRSMVQYFLMMMAMLQQEDKPAFDKMMENLTGKSKSSKKSQQSQNSGNSDGTPGDGESGPNQDSKNNPDNKSNSDSDSKNQSSNQSNQSNQPTNNSKSPGTGNQQQSLKDNLDVLKKRFEDSKTGKNLLKEILNQAKKTVDMLENTMTDAQLKDLWIDLASDRSKVSEKASAKTDMDYLNNIERELKKISFNLGGIKGRIKQLLDRSISYFSAKEKIYFENIFDSGTLDGLQDYELLHPVLRKISIEDINVREIERIGKIDIYVDASGSMNSPSGIFGEDGKSISKLLFAKSFAYKMKEMNLLNNIYSFQNHVKFEGNTSIDILNLTGGGGTSINNVIQSIEAKKHNAIVLTDAEDGCHQYTSQAYFIGIKGADFSRFTSDIFEQYLDKKQLCIFDGTRIYEVDSYGRAVK